MSECLRHKIVYESPRGFGNEFDLAVVPVDWVVTPRRGAEGIPAERRVIKGAEALRLWGTYRRRGLVRVYRCPVCGHAPGMLDSVAVFWEGGPDGPEVRHYRDSLARG